MPQQHTIAVEVRGLGMRPDRLVPGNTLPPRWCGQLSSGGSVTGEERSALKRHHVLVRGLSERHYEEAAAQSGVPRTAAAHQRPPTPGPLRVQRHADSVTTAHHGVGHAPLDVEQLTGTGGVVAQGGAHKLELGQRVQGDSRVGLVRHRAISLSETLVATSIQRRSGTSTSSDAPSESSSLAAGGWGQ